MEYITVFSNPSPGVIAIAKSVLDAEGIAYIVPDEAVVNIYGVGAFGRIEIQVPKDQVQKARELLSSVSELDD